MNIRKLTRFGTVVLLCLMGASGSLQAEEWQWPEKPENLQKLPKDWPGERLAPVMLGFSRSLGVRCSHCHVGEEGEPLSTYDFASDENPNKDRARVMLDLLGAVNEKLKEIEPSGDTRVNMWCHTCHRGRPRPMTLAEELQEVYVASGADGMVERYHALKDEYFGKGAYEFSDSSLEYLARRLVDSEEPKGAVEALALSTREFPESSRAWTGLGEAYTLIGETQSARESFEKALELDENNRRARDKLQQLNE